MMKEEEVPKSEELEIIEEVYPVEPVEEVQELTDYDDNFDNVLAELKEQSEEMKTLNENIEELNKVIMESEKENVPAESIDPEQMDSLIGVGNLISEKLDILLDSLSLFSGASSSIITYAVFYVPLMVIVYCLWWFFKQFIR